MVLALERPVLVRVLKGIFERVALWMLCIILTREWGATLTLQTPLARLFRAREDAIRVTVFGFFERRTRKGGIWSLICPQGRSLEIGSLVIRVAER